MSSRHAALEERRLALIEEIAQERERAAALLAEIRSSLVIAGLGLLAGRLLRRSRWLRLLATGGAVVTAALPLLARWLPQRRTS